MRYGRPLLNSVSGTGWTCCVRFIVMSTPLLAPDWFDYATGREPSIMPQRHRIPQITAIELATKAIDGENDIALVIEDFCDRQYIYGDVRNDITNQVLKEFEWISEFFYGPGCSY